MTQNQDNTITLKKTDLIKKYTDNGFSSNEAVSEIDFAIEILCGLNAKDLLIGIMPSKKDILKLNKIIEERVMTRKPMAQLLGYSFFMGYKFQVSEDTLIPRPETELLVAKAIEIINRNNYNQVLDIGTGSGCIACMIAKKTVAQVLGIDISKEALKIALNNTMAMNLMNKALFRKSDLFSNISEKFDIIVSNPPYIPYCEKDSLQIEVKEYEPACALFAQDEQGVEFYRNIIENSKNYLNTSGHIVFELGQNQSEEVTSILEEHGYANIEVLQDVTGINRVISASL